MKLVDHRLKDDAVNYKATEKHGDIFAADLPDTIIIHYTGTTTLKSALNVLGKSEDVRASAHIIVGPDGAVAQLVDFNTIAWHAGRSSYDGREALNRYSIGIEIVNPGWLVRHRDTYSTWYGKEVAPGEVMEARHRNAETPERYWHRYNGEQIIRVKEICELLAKTYPIKNILGHDEISPGRKQDPGPAFPLDKLRDSILESRRDHLQLDYPLDAIVKPGVKLNIRANPNRRADKVAQPLTGNQAVAVLEKRDGWYRVKTQIEGWVSAKYIQTKS